MAECHCDAGWICDEHPDLPWPHDDACSGAGMRCNNPDCPWWKGPQPGALMLDDGNFLRVGGGPPRKPKKPN